MRQGVELLFLPEEGCFSSSSGRLGVESVGLGRAEDVLRDFTQHCIVACALQRGILFDDGLLHRLGLLLEEVGGVLVVGQRPPAWRRGSSKGWRAGKNVRFPYQDIRSSTRTFSSFLYTFYKNKSLTLFQGP